MNILLIDVHYEKTRKSLHADSLTLRTLSALTPKNHTVELVNVLKTQKFDYNEQYDIIGISSVTPSVNYAYEIADNFRKHGKTVVMGGYHASALPSEAKQHADSVVVGEGEIVWNKLLNDFENKKLEPFYENNKPIDPSVFPNPIRPKDKTAGKHSVVTTARGCPYGCDFCSIYHRKFGKIFRKKSIEKVISDVKSIKSNFFVFGDASLTIDLEYTKQIFKAMKDLNKKFNCFGNINVLAEDKYLLKLASEAGCVLWHVGMESIKPESLILMKKKTNKIEDYKVAIKNINDYNMNVLGEFVFGFDTDTPDIFEKTEDAIKDLNMMPGFQVLVPYPGSPLFRRLDDEDRILTKDWSEYTINNVVFQPKNMAPDFLKNEVINIYKEFYSTYPVIKRIFKSIKFGYHPLLSSIKINFSIARRYV